MIVLNLNKPFNIDLQLFHRFLFETSDFFEDELFSDIFENVEGEISMNSLKERENASTTENQKDD